MIKSWSLTPEKWGDTLKTETQQERREAMNVTLLGTSHGVPEPNRRCSCSMVEVSGRYYFIDMGMNAIDEIVTRQIPVDAVKGVFITQNVGI